MVPLCCGSATARPGRRQFFSLFARRCVKGIERRHAMRRLIQLTIGSFVFVTMPLAAEDRPPPMAQAVYASAAMLATMNDNMEHMRKQIERIRETTDPSERARLMQDHIRLMTWQMEMAKHVTDAEWQYLESTGANRDGGATPSGGNAARPAVLFPMTLSATAMTVDTDSGLRVG